MSFGLFAWNRIKRSPCVLGNSFDMARLPFAAVERGEVPHEPGVGVEILIGEVDQVPPVEVVD